MRLIIMAAAILVAINYTTVRELHYCTLPGPVVLDHP
jgi:hypothetical protein